MIRVEALPAADGDCLWLEWPDPAGRTRRMLIDGGHGRPDRLSRALAHRLDRCPSTDRDFDIVVCTHIDADHIGGLLALVDDPPPGFRTRDVWFNGRHHLDVLGPAQGDHLSTGLRQATVPWNQAFDGGPVVVPLTADLPVIQLPGLRITLLSPGRAQLAELARQWPVVLAQVDADLTPGPAATDILRTETDDGNIVLHKLARRPFTTDGSAANGSSIAFLAESDDGSRVLMTGDATAEVLTAAVRRLSGSAPLRVDLVKVPHHGSRHNTSGELLAALDCCHWLVTTSGARFGHPGREAMARILCRPQPATVWFNYLSNTTWEYADPELAARYGFSAVHPPAGSHGIAVDVHAGDVVLAP